MTLDGEMGSEAIARRLGASITIKPVLKINGQGLAPSLPGQTDDSTLHAAHACHSATQRSHIP